MKAVWLCCIACFITVTAFGQVKRISHPPSVQNLPPTPAFSWLNTCAGDTTCFINQSIRAYSFTWTITGDTVLPPFGVIQPKTLFTATNSDTVYYHFRAAGVYTVTLDAYDNHYASLSKILSIDTATKADFGFLGCRNNFLNNSLCSSAFLWNFGDGSQSTEALPVHQYADTGTYSVKLIAYNGNKSDTIVQQLLITAEAFADPAFTYIIKHDTVYFHAVSTSEVTNFNWSFGDTHYGSGRDTMNIYKDSTAFYTVDIDAINSCGPSFGGDTVYINTTAVKPVAAFYWLNSCLDDTTFFINQTQPAGGFSYRWTIKTESASVIDTLLSANGTNSYFTFPKTGTYTVNLHVYSYADTSIEKIIVIDSLVTADFSYEPCSNRFLNLSGCASSFFWDFGDGISSLSQFPQHPYSFPGYYTVTLIAYTGGTSDTVTKQISSTTGTLPDAAFKFDVAYDTLIAQVISPVAGTLYNWDFADNTTASGQSASHIYKDSTAFYVIRLTASNSCGYAYKTDTVFIRRYVPSVQFGDNNLVIAPNPVRNRSYIDAFYNSFLDGDYLVSVFNALGETMFEEVFSFQTGINEFKISNSNLCTGLYILVMQNGNNYSRKKFYIMNEK